MTDVLVRLTAASSGAAASGWVPADEVAAAGHLECRPWAPDPDGARLHLEGPDRLLLPASMPPVRLVAGEATLHLAPTGAGWCWQIIERTPRGKTRYVLVPDSVATLDYADLIDVDPATLSPAEAAVPAWTAAVDQVRQLRDDTYALLPLMESVTGAATAVQTDALAAIAAAETAQMHAGQAGQHRQAAEQAAAGAAAAAQAIIAQATADAIAAVRAETTHTHYDPVIGWITTKGPLDA